MLHSVTITGYRCFAELKVEGLTQVNLIVGKNNAGKTSLLEAVEMLLLREHPDAVLRSSWRRQEVVSRGLDPTNGSPKDVLLDVRHLFHGRQLDDGSGFMVDGGTDEHGKVARFRSRVEGRGSRYRLGLFDGGAPPRYAPLQGTAVPPEQLSASGDPPDRMIPPIVFASMDRVDPQERVRLWDLVVGNESEDFVTAAMQLLEPDIERVIFTVGGPGSMPAAFVRIKGNSERVPLGNLGHGASRLFDLALLMVQARGGAFLIDEVEIGLHHSVMESVWKLIVENARRLHLQVFATTHSQDCLRALATLYRADRSLAETVSLHRLDPGVAHAVRFSMDDLEVAEEALLELRGAP